MPSTQIIDFWKANRDYWITPPLKHAEVDNLIYTKFWNHNWHDENIIGQIIWLDQFSRHFQRSGHLSELQVENNRITAAIIFYDNQEEIETFDETEIVFALMPFKHLKDYKFIFAYLHYTWLRLKRGRLNDFPLLQKFYIDTYKKAYTLEKVSAGIVTNHETMSYDAARICEFYPPSYASGDWILDGTGEKAKKLINCLDMAMGPLNNKKVIVSLSGGVDSMVMLTLLKYKGALVEAVHIIYGNRKESEHEYQFLVEFCRRLGVKLYVYRIEWLRRGEVDRQFYEDMTRDLRFMCYRALGNEGEQTDILLGHIKDDVVENIWTNIARCQHLGDLKKMSPCEEQLGVRLWRPFLEVEKSDIYEVSEVMGIPYFKNTTPSWSNRGKFREHFHSAVVQQFGDSVDDKLIEFAEAVSGQNKLLYTLLYEPIYESFKDNTVNITGALKAGLDASNWMIIFEHICHKNLGRARPSIHCVRDFCSRISRPFVRLNCEMGKGLKIQINKHQEEYFMMFIC